MTRVSKLSVKTAPSPDGPVARPRGDIAAALLNRMINRLGTCPVLDGFIEARVRISPDLASDLLKLNFAGQRNVRLDQVRTLANAMASGSYAPNNLIAFSYNVEDLNDVAMVALLNGQHTLHAIVASGKTQPLIVSLFPCRAKADIEFHYALFDQGRTRTQLDISRAVGLNDTVRHAALPKAAVTALGSSASLLRAHLIDSRLVDKDKRRNATISKMWVGEAAAIFALIEAPDRRLNPDAPPIGEMGRQFRKRLISHAFFAVALVSMRSHPEETTAILRQLTAMADSADHGAPEGDQFVWDVVYYLTTSHLGTGTERRIAAYNFAHLMVELRQRPVVGDTGRTIGHIIVNGVPSVHQSDALWDTLTEDRLPRSIVNV